jgi:sugar O-acyltransferase (sialic acid O-acetyltransferase NeuD family)
MEIAGVIGEPRGRTDLLGVRISESAAGIEADAFIIAVGDNRSRAEQFAAYLKSGLPAAAVVHPSAIIAPGVEIGAGSLVAAGVVVNVDTRVGVDAILNTSCSVDHDCVIGDHAHVGPMTGLCGGVGMGTGALLGVGCSIIPTRCIGEWAVVGAGSVVVRDVPADALQAGVPARSLGQAD